MFRIPSRAQARAAFAVTAVSLLLAACGGSDDAPSARASVLSDVAVATVPKAQIDAATQALQIQPLTGPARCDVTVRKLVHTTVGPNGVAGPTASAGVLVPSVGPTCPGPFPVVAYTPGTNVVKARTLSNPTENETALLTGFLAAQGYVVVATDYLGYADSDFPFHPYLHADTQASTTVDAVRAARTALDRLGVPLSGKLFVTGYSQGGHAAMATHRAIEADPSLGLTVTAAGPMSGPYDVTSTFVAGLGFLPSGTGGSSVLTPLVVTAWQRIYGNLYTTPADYFKSPYATGIESLLPGTLSFEQLYAQGKLPVALADLVTPRALADVGDANSGFRRAMAANTLLGWTPKAPLLLCGGAKDPVVLYAPNTAGAAADFRTRGGNVTEVDVEKVPAFAPILATFTPETYHGAVIVPCLAVVRDQLFAALR